MYDLLKNFVSASQNAMNIAHYNSFIPWFQFLPVYIQHTILFKLDYFSLISFYEACPHFRNHIMSHIIWSKFKYYLNSKTLAQKEIFALSKILNKYLLNLEVEMDNLTDQNFEYIMQYILNMNENITKLSILGKSCENIMVDLCGLKRLTRLELKLYKISDYSLMIIADNLKLSSLLVHSKTNVHEGILYFLKSSKDLEEFGLVIPFINKE